MLIAFSSEPMGRAKSDDFRQIGVVLPQANGLVVVQSGPTSPSGVAPLNPGTILGVSPNGDYSYGDPNAIGNGQQFKFSDGSLTIQPNVYQGSVLIPGAPTMGYVIAAKVIG